MIDEKEKAVRIQPPKTVIMKGEGVIVPDDSYDYLSEVTIIPDSAPTNGEDDIIFGNDGIEIKGGTYGPVEKEIPITGKITVGKMFYDSVNDEIILNTETTTGYINTDINASCDVDALGLTVKDIELYPNAKWRTVVDAITEESLLCDVIKDNVYVGEDYTGMFCLRPIHETVPTKGAQTIVEIDTYFVCGKPVWLKVRYWGHLHDAKECDYSFGKSGERELPDMSSIIDQVITLPKGYLSLPTILLPVYIPAGARIEALALPMNFTNFKYTKGGNCND